MEFTLRTTSKPGQLVIITGLSGAGKSTAMRVFEDLGRYCIDNLPPSLIPNFYNLWQQSGAIESDVVVASDVRSGALFADFQDTINSLKKERITFKILYLDAASHVLINRFNEVRRSHPLQPELSIKDAIEEERRRLTPFRAIATHVIDTSQMNVDRLREAILQEISNNNISSVMNLNFVSFGFKYGTPRDADFLIDVRFLPNPFYVSELQQHTGKDNDVYNYVMSNELADAFFEKFVEMISLTLKSFIKVGKHTLNIAVGCTGGRHRSVAFAKRLANHFSDEGRKATSTHRDLAKPQN